MDGLRRRLIAIVSASVPTLVACGPQPAEPETESSGDGTGSGIQPSTTGPGASSGADASSSGGTLPDLGSAEDDGADVRLDLGAMPDVGRDLDPTTCVQWRPNTTFACADRPSSGIPAYQCGPLPADGTCGDDDAVAVTQAVNDCFDPECFGWFAWDVMCGPDPDVTDACCYWLLVDEGQICPGRPFLVDGHDRLAPLRSDNGTPSPWACRNSDRPHPMSLDSQRRAAMAEVYAQAGLFEHASVASFARFTLVLLAVGAPPELVAASVQATQDEIGHARLWFGLAAAYGHPVTPGALDVNRALDDTTDLRRALVSALREGCIAETISALQARAAARVTADPALRHRLERLADEEERHCELAWAFVAWVLDRDPTLGPTVTAELTRAVEHVPRGPAIPDQLDAAVLHEGGLLSVVERRTIAAATLERIVAPVGAALVGRTRAPQGLRGAARGT